MSHAELGRLEIVQRILDRRLSHRAGAESLGISTRQMKRIVARYRAQGPDGLVSGKRGKPGNHRLPDAFKEHVVGLVRTHYSDFGPTLASEKLLERHGISVNRETLRQLMRQDGLWLPRAQRRKAIQQLRPRRDCYGELIQIDGSEHRWFEDRAPMCTVLTFVDDATSRIQLLRFVQGESTFDYMEATKDYIRRYGKPLAFYSDKHTVFHVNKRSSLGGNGMTQYGRALHQMSIEILCANSAEAKGRVERAHGTLQDRLVKEMRLEGISSMDDANAWIDAYMDRHNAKFAKPPRFDFDVHRPLQPFEDLEDTFTWQEYRTLSRSLSLQYDKVLYMVDPTPENSRLAGKRVAVIDFPDGSIKIRHEGRDLPFRQFDKLTQTHQGEVVSHKRLGAMLDWVAQQRSELRSEKRSVKCPTRRYPAPARLT